MQWTFMSSLIFICNSTIVRSLVSSVSRKSRFFFLSSDNSYIYNTHTNNVATAYDVLLTVYQASGR